MHWLLLPLGFLFGSIPFGLIIGKIKGIDIRQHGSGNIGATNAFRILGKPAGITCLLLDFVKGLTPVLLAKSISPDNSVGQTVEVCTALAAILGHNYSPWIGFKGGKGIATTAGALTALMPFGIPILILVFIIVTVTTKYVSLGSIMASAALPILVLWGSWYHHGFPPNDNWNVPLIIFSFLAAFLAIYKHRSNITRLRKGTEHKIGQKKAS